MPDVNELKKRIRHVPDFPKPGILFYDVTTLLQDAGGLQMALDAMTAPWLGTSGPSIGVGIGIGVDVVVGIESRGFIFGAAMADRLKAGFSPVRKPGKLPYKTRRASYALEYGSDALEIHEDAVRPGQKVLIVDDLLATGGTAAATVGLVRSLGADVVGVQFLIELAGLDGRSKLAGETVEVVLKY